MPFEIFTAHHNVTLSQVASLSRMNLRSPYTDAILADSDVPTLENELKKNGLSDLIDSKIKIHADSNYRYISVSLWVGAPFNCCNNLLFGDKKSKMPVTSI